MQTKRRKRKTETLRYDTKPQPKEENRDFIGRHSVDTGALTNQTTKETA